MTGIELYINQQLCDIDNPGNFSIYLKRQLLNPAELSTKDAQRSYDITLPATATNNAIFGYINTEEVNGKFSQLYNATVAVGGEQIFEGKFKLSEVTKTTYKGNLGVPKSKTIKDIFGDKNMNEAGEWMVEFGKFKYFAENAGKFNKDKKPLYFFPLALYGLVPKEVGNSNPPKNILDDTVRLTPNNLPPSINCLEAIKKIFENTKDYNISGSAFDDERLSHLYMSYKNPKEYRMPWNNDDNHRIQIRGKWENIGGYDKTSTQDSNTERGHSYTSDSNNDLYNQNGSFHVDLFNSTMAYNLQTLAPNRHAKLTEEKDNNGHTRKRCKIIIPESGYYKVRLFGEIFIPHPDRENIFEARYDSTIIISGNGKDDDPFALYDSHFLNNRYELKLIRMRKGEYFNLSRQQMDGGFYRKNQSKHKSAGDKETPYGAYFPQIMDASVKKNDSGKGYIYTNRQILFIDANQNDRLIAGLSWGKWMDKTQGKDDRKVGYVANPTDGPEGKWGIYAHLLAGSPAKSWNTTANNRKIATNSDTYITSVGTESSPQYIASNRHRMTVKNTPKSYIVRGGEGRWTPEHWEGKGEINLIAWFDKGDTFALLNSSDTSNYKPGGDSTPKWVAHNYKFELDITPFKTNEDLMEIDQYGNLKKDINWNDDGGTDFMGTELDLIKFLPSNMKIDEWLDNFCKAFNLTLRQVGDKEFSLDTARDLNTNTSVVIDLDKKADVNINRSNTDMGMPSSYELGFKIDKNEEGYVRSNNEDGGGKFAIENSLGKEVKQTSNFSYNWMKKMTNIQNPKLVELPIISDKKVWEDEDAPYEDLMKERYTDKALRFWYKKNGPKEEDSTVDVKMEDGKMIKAGLVRNELEKDEKNGIKPLVLHYKNLPNSIMDTYFTVFVDNNTHFTSVECHLTPEEYNNIDTSLVKLNGDLYYVAEVDGYDPMGKKKAKIKLIKKGV